MQTSIRATPKKTCPLGLLKHVKKNCRVYAAKCGELSVTAATEHGQEVLLLQSTAMSANAAMESKTAQLWLAFGRHAGEAHEYQVR